MKVIGQGVRKLEPEQPDTHTHTQTDRQTNKQTDRQTDRQTHATENITFPHSRLVMRIIKHRLIRLKFYKDIVSEGRNIAYLFLGERTAMKAFEGHMWPLGHRLHRDDIDLMNYCL